MGVLTLAFVPTAAEAQHLSFDGCAYGSTSSFKVCASAESWYNSAVGTLFFKVVNLNQSSASNPSYSDYASDTGGWGTITAIGLENMVKEVDYSVGTGGLQLSLNYWNGSAFEAISPTKWKVGASSIQIEETSAATDGHKEGIVGGYDPGSDNADHLQTTEGRYAQFEISGFSSFAFNENVLFEWHTQQVADESGVNKSSRRSSSVSTSNSLKGSIPGITNVVPEPVSMVLLGTGLLGLGAMRKMRRRGRSEGPRES